MSRYLALITLVSEPPYGGEYLPKDASTSTTRPRMLSLSFPKQSGAPGEAPPYVDRRHHGSKERVLGAYARWRIFGELPRTLYRRSSQNPPSTHLGE